MKASRLNAVVTSRLKLVTTLNSTLGVALLLQGITEGLNVASPVWVSVVAAVLLVSGTYSTVIYFGKHGLKARTVHLLHVLSLVNALWAGWALFAFVKTL